MIRLIIAGGQTGVDRAALDFARNTRILATGWCPKGRLAEDGVLSSSYPLMETDRAEYEERSEWNVRDSDATLVILNGAPDEGTSTTIETALNLEKLFYIQDLGKSVSPEIALMWIKKHRIALLNVAGPRESSSPGIYQKAYSFLAALFAALQRPEYEMEDRDDGDDNDEQE